MNIPANYTELAEAMAQRVQEWDVSGAIWVKGEDELEDFDAWKFVPKALVPYAWENGGPAVMLAVAKHICPLNAATILRDAKDINGGGLGEEDNPDYVVKLGEPEYHPLLIEQFRKILPRHFESVDFSFYRDDEGEENDDSDDTDDEEF